MGKIKKDRVIQYILLVCLLSILIKLVTGFNLLPYLILGTFCIALGFTLYYIIRYYLRKK